MTGTIPSHSMYLTYFIKKKYKYLQVVRAVLSTKDLVGWNLADTRRLPASRSLLDGVGLFRRSTTPLRLISWTWFTAATGAIRLG